MFNSKLEVTAFLFTTPAGNNLSENKPRHHDHPMIFFLERPPGGFRDRLSINLRRRAIGIRRPLRIGWSKRMASFILLFVATAAFGMVHSLLASHWAKNHIQELLGTPGRKLYRFTFNGFAFLTLFPILILLVRYPGPMIFRFPMPWWILTLAVQFLALIFLAVAFRESNPEAFLGLQQLGPDPAPSPLRITGTYGIVRHPLYTGTMMLLWLMPIVTTGTLGFELAAILYFWIGSELEERKLIAEYPADYPAYKKKVARFIPFVY
jgi:protein-S-isoprenylcysteine O-methyltransferase Ste14